MELIEGISDLNDDLKFNIIINDAKEYINGLNN